MRNLKIEKMIPNLNAVIGCTSYELADFVSIKDCDDEFFDELILIKNYLYQLTDEEKLEIYKEIVDFDEFDEQEKDKKIRLIERTQDSIDDYLRWVNEENKKHIKK